MIDDFNICSELRQYLCDIFLCLGLGSCRGPRAGYEIGISLRSLLYSLMSFIALISKRHRVLEFKDIQRERFSISVELVSL